MRPCGPQEARCLNQFCGCPWAGLRPAIAKKCRRRHFTATGRTFLGSPRKVPKEGDSRGFASLRIPHVLFSCATRRLSAWSTPMPWADASACFCAPYLVLCPLGAICVSIGCKSIGLCSPSVQIQCSDVSFSTKTIGPPRPSRFWNPPKNGLKQSLRPIHGSTFGLDRTDHRTSAKQIKT